MGTIQFGHVNESGLGWTESNKAYWCYFAADNLKLSADKDIATVEIHFVDEMEASATVEASNNDQAFRRCERTGRRGACIDTDIVSDKLQDLIQKSEKLVLDEGQSSQSTEDEKKA